MVHYLAYSVCQSKACNSGAQKRLKGYGTLHGTGPSSTVKQHVVSCSTFKLSTPSKVDDPEVSSSVDIERTSCRSAESSAVIESWKGCNTDDMMVQRIY